jgi:hypothetical protein
MTQEISEWTLKVKLCQEFGWTLDYVDSLDMWQITTILGVLDGWDQVAKAKR